MTLFDILFLALGLAMDAFAVCLGIGTTGRCAAPRPTFRLAFHFGLFQAGMPVLGWFAGRTVATHISTWDHWVAFGLLTFVGVHMIHSALNHDEDPPDGRDPSRGHSLVMLSVATSIDALAVGLSLAMFQVAIIYPALVIGIVTGGLSLVGLRLGHRLGSLLGKRVEIAGGMVLIAIGLRMLVDRGLS